jgi:hypothetical protein
VFPVGELPPDGVVLAGVVAPLDGVVAPLDGDVDPLAVVPVPVVDELLEVLVVVAGATAGGVLGTLNAGTPAVSAVPVPPPPQAASPNPTAIESTIAGTDLDLRADPATNPLRSRAAPCACRTPGSH